MTGTLAVYTLIISFGICICTPRLKKQSSIILKKKDKSHKQMNHKKTNIFFFKGKVSSGTELKQKENTQTQHHNHNTKNKPNKGKPKKGCIRENTCRETKRRRRKTTERNTGNAERKSPTRP